MQTNLKFPIRMHPQVKKVVANRSQLEGFVLGVFTRFIQLKNFHI